MKSVSFHFTFTCFQAWTECVENSGAQLEHQRTRIMNLDLMLDYGAESWKQYNEVLQDMLNRIQVTVNIENTPNPPCINTNKTTNYFYPWVRLNWQK